MDMMTEGLTSREYVIASDKNKLGSLTEFVVDPFRSGVEEVHLELTLLTLDSFLTTI